MGRVRTDRESVCSHAPAKELSKDLSNPSTATSASPRNNAPITRGRPFAPGNAGRPRGARHKTSLAIEALLEGQHEALTQKAISMALAGDITAIRLCLERLAPPRRDAPISIDLPYVSSARDTLAASTAIIGAVSRGELTTSEGGALTAILSAHQKFVETLDLELRLAQLEHQSKLRR